jgi:hypothetical protein
MPTTTSAAKIKYIKNVQVANVQVATGGVYAKAQHGNGTPIELELPPVAGAMYVNDVDSTLWIAVSGIWKQLV